MSPDTPCDTNGGSRPAASACEMEQNLEILGRHPSFSDAPRERLRLYAYLAKRQSFAPGQELFRQGEPGDGAWLILDGVVVLLREMDEAWSRQDREGEGEGIEVLRLGPGDLVGGLSLLAPGPRCLTGRAETLVEVLLLDRDSFRRVAERFPQDLPAIVAKIAAGAQKLQNAVLRGLAEGLCRREGRE